MHTCQQMTHVCEETIPFQSSHDSSELITLQYIALDAFGKPSVVRKVHTVYEIYVESQELEWKYSSFVSNVCMASKSKGTTNIRKTS